MTASSSFAKRQVADSSKLYMRAKERENPNCGKHQRRESLSKPRSGARERESSWYGSISLLTFCWRARHIDGGCADFCARLETTSSFSLARQKVPRSGSGSAGADHLPHLSQRV
jgi:hypothetical protein